MNTIQFERNKEIIKNKKKLEEKLKIRIIVQKNFIIIDGNPLDEYEASIVLEAVNEGFPVETALNLIKEEIIFKKLNIKDYTKRKDISVVRGRIIGTHGKTKKTLEQITDCSIKIKENNVSIIGHAEEVKNVITSIISIIRGAKQKNAYKYLERINTKNKKNI